MDWFSSDWSLNKLSVVTAASNQSHVFSRYAPHLGPTHALPQVRTQDLEVARRDRGCRSLTLVKQTMVVSGSAGLKMQCSLFLV